METIVESIKKYLERKRKIKIIKKQQKCKHEWVIEPYPCEHLFDSVCKKCLIQGVSPYNQPGADLFHGHENQREEFEYYLELSDRIGAG